MGKRFGENTKAAEAKDRQRQAAEQKAIEAAEKKEAQLAKEWSLGSKKVPKHEIEKLKREEKKKEKEELEKQVAQETLKVKSVHGSRSSLRKLDNGEKQFGGLDETRRSNLSLASSGTHTPTESYAASDLESAIRLLDALDTTDNTPKSQLIDRHPERRVAAAYRAFSEDKMPKLRIEFPTLRYSQLKELLDREWKKSPRNPLNQEHVVSFNTTKKEIEALVDKKREDTLMEFKEKHV